MTETKLQCKQCQLIKNLIEFREKYHSTGYSCKDCEKEYAKKHRKENPNKIRETNNKYNKAHRQQIRERDRKKLLKSVTGDKIRERARFNRERYMKDPHFKIMHNTRTKIGKFLKANGQSKSTKTEELLGCTKQFLKEWLEYQFNSYMSWNNYGIYWHIDHVTPCDAFDAANEDDLKKCFNWKNLRPLKGSENNSKSSKIIIKDILNQEIKVHYYSTLKF